MIVLLQNIMSTAEEDALKDNDLNLNEDYNTKHEVAAVSMLLLK